MKTKHVLLLTGVIGLGLLSQAPVSTVQAKSTDTFQLRYFENYMHSDSDDDGYRYQIGYVDNNGNSRSVSKDSDRVDEYITDTGKATVSGISGSATVTRPPYQVYDVKAKSSNVKTMGWSDFINKNSSVKGQTLDVKWCENTNNETIGSSDYPNVLVIEFAFKGQLYRMYMPNGSLGYSHYTEDVSPSYTKPKLKFDSDGDMTYQRAPYTNYVQSAKSGKVVEK